MVMDECYMSQSSAYQYRSLFEKRQAHLLCLFIHRHHPHVTEWDLPYLPPEVRGAPYYWSWLMPPFPFFRINVILAFGVIMMYRDEQKRAIWVINSRAEEFFLLKVPSAIEKLDVEVWGHISDQYILEFRMINWQNAITVFVCRLVLIIVV